MIEKMYGNKCMVTCDNCGTGRECDNWADVIDFMNEEGWKKRLVDGEFEHYCPECQKMSNTNDMFQVDYLPEKKEKRLTKRDENGNAYYDWGCLNRNHWALGRHVDRLAAYEDTGLSPEQVQELAKAKADGRLVERGTWINGYCSNCNSPIPTDNKDDYIAKNECRFCYYCGAKMEEAAEKALGVGE